MNGEISGASTESHTGRGRNDLALSGSQRLLGAWGRLFGFSSLFHFGWISNMPDRPFGKTVLLTSLLLIAFPAVWQLEGALLIALTAYFFRHDLIVGQGHFVLWLCLIPHFFWNASRAHADRPGQSPRLQRTAGLAALRAARVAAVATYTFAFLHKLNWDYFVLGASEPTRILGDIGWSGPIVRAIEPFAIGATVVTEGAMAVLLVFRKSRPLAVALGLGFHFVLGCLGFYAFSSVMYCLLLSFGPIGAGIQARAALRGRYLPLLAPRFEWYGTLLKIWGGAALFAFACLEPGRASRGAWVALWVVYALGVVATWAGDGLGDSRTSGEPPRAAWYAPAAVGSILAFFGMGPYIGHTNLLSFDMYSKLRAGGFRTNHLFMPASLQLPFFQGHLVQVEATNARQLMPLTTRDRRVPYAYVVDLVDWMPDAALAWCRITLTDAGTTRTMPCQELKGRLGPVTRFLPPLLFQFKTKVAHGEGARPGE